MNGTFLIFLRKAQSVDELLKILLSFDGILPDPTDKAGVVIAESKAAAKEAINALSQAPPQNPWKVLLHLEPTKIHVYREATPESLDYFKPILKNVLLPLASRIEDEEGREIDLKISGAIEDYLLA